MSRQRRHLPRSGDSRDENNSREGCSKESGLCAWQKIKKHSSPEQHSKCFICLRRALPGFLPPLFHTLEPIILKVSQCLQRRQWLCFMQCHLNSVPWGKSSCLCPVLAQVQCIFNAQEGHRAMNCVFRAPSGQQFTVSSGDFQVHNKITVNQGK